MRQIPGCRLKLAVGRLSAICFNIVLYLLVFVTCGFELRSIQQIDPFMKADSRYFVVYNRTSFETDIYTTMIDAANHIGISADTLSRRFRKNLSHTSPGYITSVAYGIHVSKSRSAISKLLWADMKSHIPY